jgi:hypothetical protein
VAPPAPTLHSAGGGHGARLLHDPLIARRAAELGATVRADADQSTVVDHLEQIVTGLPAH